MTASLLLVVRSRSRRGAQDRERPRDCYAGTSSLVLCTRTSPLVIFGGFGSAVSSFCSRTQLDARRVARSSRLRTETTRVAPMPDLSLIVLVLLAWMLLAMSIAIFFVAIGRGRPSGLGGELDGDPRTGRVDRRTASRDRRVGLPDTRAVRTERRSGTPDRRRGPAVMA